MHEKSHDQREIQRNHSKDSSRVYYIVSEAH